MLVPFKTTVLPFASTTWPPLACKMPDVIPPDVVPFDGEDLALAADLVVDAVGEVPFGDAPAGETDAEPAGEGEAVEDLP